MPQSQPREENANDTSALTVEAVKVADDDSLEKIKKELATAAYFAYNAPRGVTWDEWVKLGGALTVGGSALPLYLEATKQADWIIRGSSTGANVLINIYAGKASLDFLQKKWKESKKSVFGLFLLAALPAAPFAVICLSLSKHGPGYRSFEAASTLLGGIVMYMFALTQLSFVWHFFSRDLGFYIRNILGRASNLEKQDRIEQAGVLDLRQQDLAILGQINLQPFSSSRNPDQLFNSATDVELKKMLLAPKNNRLVSSMIRGALIVSVFIALSLGTIPYTCDTEKASRELFGLSEWEAFSLASFAMFLQYALNFTGAVSTVNSLWNVLGQLFQCQFKNDLKLGSLPIVIARFALPFLAIVIASRSGYVTAELKDKSCSSSKLSWPMHFPGMEQFVFYSAAVFNAIYVAMGFEFFLSLVVKYFCGRPNAEDSEKNTCRNRELRDSLNMRDAIVAGRCNSKSEEETRSRRNSVFSMTTIIGESNDGSSAAAALSPSSSGFFANVRRTVFSGLSQLFSRCCGKEHEIVAGSPHSYHAIQKNAG